MTRSAARRIAIDYGLAIAAVAAAIGLRWALTPVIGDTAPLIFLLLPITLMAWVAGLWPALFATALGCAAGLAMFGQKQPATYQALLPWWLSRSVPFLLVGGLISAFASHLERSRERAAHSEERLRLVFESVLDYAIFTTDLRGHVTTWNVGAERVFGYNEEEIIGQSAEILYTPAGRQEGLPHREMDTALVNGRAREERWLVRKDGSQLMAGGMIAVLRDDANQPVGFTRICRDITEAKAAEQALRESEARFRNMSDNAPVIVWQTRADGHCEFLNKQWYDFTGQAEADALGFGWLNAVHPEDAKRTSAAFFEATERRTPFHVEYRLLRHDGEYRWCLDSATPRSSPDGMFLGYIGSVIDISERIVAAKEREALLTSERAARAEAERVSRMKDEFLATLGHELRTPLNAILGWSQIMKRDPNEVADIIQGIDVIERNARAQAQIIEDLLDMSRIISGKVRLDVQPLNLTALASAALDTCRPAADAKGVMLLSDIRPQQAIINGDANRLQQVLWNLLSNAVKFTPNGGRVEVLLRQTDTHIEISIADTGEGIAATFLPFVFDRFRQADGTTTRRFGGLGLGLSIVKQLVELHGGTVQVKSEGVGCGSVFSVMLPLAFVPDAESGNEPVKPATLRNGGVWTESIRLTGIRVLVVDDEPDARALVCRLLEDREAKVHMAASAAEAIDHLRSHRPDILVSDIGMPGEDGYALIRHIRSLDADAGGKTPAIALTAYARAEDRVKAVVGGFQMHLAKPVEPAELIAMVATLTGRTSAN
ncbi:MAG: hypothetical protein JWM57_3758 [Phycisphaerales bacterium]|nr:hypothetical protein [Phycisphaerales bacterium]